MSFNLFNRPQDATENLIAQAGKDVKVNGVNRKVLITNPSLAHLKPDTRYMTDVDAFNSGDKVIIDGKNWLVTGDVGGKRAGGTYKAIINYVPHRLQFVKGYFDFATVYCYSDVQSLGIDSNQFLTWTSGKLNLITAYDTDAKRIAINDRFIKFGSAWKVTGLDYQTVAGVLIIKASVDTIQTANDFVAGELANFYPTHPAGSGLYEIKLLETSPVFVWAGTPHQIAYQVKYFGNVITTKPTFTVVADAALSYFPVTSHGTADTDGIFTPLANDNWTVTVNAAIGDTTNPISVKVRKPLNAAIRAIGNLNPVSKSGTSGSNYEVWYTDAAGVETKQTGATWTLDLNGHVSTDVTSASVAGGGWKLTPNVSNSTSPVYMNASITIAGTLFTLSQVVWLDKGNLW